MRDCLAGGGGGGSGCGWRRSSSHVSNMRQANGRVGSYRTVSEDYGPGKITKHKERIKLSRKRVQKMLLLTCENKRYFNYKKNVNLFFIGSTFCTLRRTCMHNVFF